MSFALDLMISESMLDKQLKSKSYLLDTDVPFSRSVLWRLMRRYYDHKGSDAWSVTGEIPSHITSNPHIARAYAENISAYIRDIAASGKEMERVSVVVSLSAVHLHESQSRHLSVFR